MPSVFKSIKKSLSRSSGLKSTKRDSGSHDIKVDTDALSSSPPNGALSHSPHTTDGSSSIHGAATGDLAPSPIGHDLNAHPSIDTAVSGDSNASNTTKQKTFSLDLAKQAVDQIVSRSAVKVESIKVGDLTSEGFHIGLHIRISKTGPAKAKITFPDGLDLYLRPTDTRAIANIDLSPIKLKRSSRTAGLIVDGRLRVTSSVSSAHGLHALFHILISASGPVDLKVASANTQVKAYGMSFKRISLEKEIRIQGLNHLGGALSFSDPSSSSAFSSRTLQRSSIKGFQITGGDPVSGISFQAQVELANPAQITARVGDIRLRLRTDVDELKSSSGDQNSFIGQVVLPDLTLKPGSNGVDISGNVMVAPQGDPSRLAGLTLIRYLLEDRSVSVTVVGSNDSSKVPWVSELFSRVQISALLPALGISSKLLDGASLIPSEDATISPQPQLFARATLRNHLGPPLHIHSLKVEAYQETDEDDDSAPSTRTDAIRLGEIRTPSDWPVLTLSSGNPVPASLPFNLSAGGASYVRILQTEAKRKGIELNENLVAALELMPTAENQAKIASAVSQSKHANNIGAQEPLDLPNLVASALSSLKVSAHILAETSIGGYRIPGEISFVQHQLPISITVKTARTILPTVGAPLVDALIDQARVSITRLKILDMDEKGLNVEADIGLVDFGPLDVEIHFDQVLNITPHGVAAQDDPAAIIGRIVFSEPLRGVAGSEERVQTRLRILPTTKSMVNFAAFVSEIIMKDQVPIQISSEGCRVVAGGADFPAVLSKAVVLPGLGGLAGLALDELDIFDEIAAPTGPGRGRALSSASISSGSSGHLGSRNPKEKAFKVRTRVRIPHKGLVAVGLSKIEAGIEFEGVQIGIITAEDIVFTLAETDVEFEATGYIFIGSESLKENQSIAQYKQAALQSFGKLATALLSGAPAELTIHGYRAFAMGEMQLLSPTRTQVPAHLRSKSSKTSIQRRESTKLTRTGSISTLGSATFTPKQVPWLDQAFQKVTIKTVLQQDLHPLIKGMQLKKISAKLLKEGSMDAEIDEISFQVEVPIGVRFEVLTVEADIEVHFEGYGCVGIGRIDNTEVQSCTPCESNGDDSFADGTGNGKACRLVRLAPGSLKLSTTPGEGLAQLIAHIADCEATDKISIRGRAHARVDVALGEIVVDVDLGQHPHVLVIDGVRGLRSSPVQYTNLQVVEASREYLKIVFSLYLNNPSKTLQMELPDTDLTMAAFYRGAYVGRAHIAQGFKLGTGPVAVQGIHFRYCPGPGSEAVRDIPANFLSGRTTTLEIRGDDESSPIALLIPALKNIHLTFELKPMMDRTLIDSISITLGVTALTAASVDAEFVVNNPLGVPFDLCSMSFIATYKGQPFGSCQIAYTPDHPLRVPAGSVKQPGQQKSSAVSVALAQPLENLVGAFLKSKGQIVLDLEVKAKVEIQGFKIPISSTDSPSCHCILKGWTG